MGKRDMLSLTRPLSLQGSSIKHSSNHGLSFYILLTMASKSKALSLGNSFVRRFQLFLEHGTDHRTVQGLDLSSVDTHFAGIGGRTVSKI